MSKIAPYRGYFCFYDETSGFLIRLSKETDFLQALKHYKYMRAKKNEMNLKEVIALITLLDDPDDGIYSEVKNRFIVLGPPAIPHLETAWENSFDALMQKRIEGIIHTIQFKALQNALKNWAENEQEDLFKGDRQTCAGL